jgi:hypothetical protein
MSNISNQHDGHLDVQTNETCNVSTLITPLVSCWEAGRWELTKARLQRSSDAPPKSTSSLRADAGEAVSKVVMATPSS